MERFLQTEEAAFYHITAKSNWESIQRTGLKKGTDKGISVLRTDDDRIVKSVIVTQLRNVVNEGENDFVLLKLSQKKNRFMPQIIKPDIVDEWTWPFHNNIMVNIHPNFIELVGDFTIEYWDKETTDDNCNKKAIMPSEMYTKALNFIYKDNDGQFCYNSDKEKEYLNEL